MAESETAAGLGTSRLSIQQDDQRTGPGYDEDEGRRVSLEGLMDSRRMKRVYCKLDLRIIPPFWILYFLCSAVRSNVGLAQTMNMHEGHDLSTRLNLSAHQVSTGLALFYVSYVVLEVPSNLAMSKLSPSIWLARIVISVGIIGTAMIGMKNAAGYYTLRLLLGAVEAGMWPGMSLFLTMFYPPHRMAKRVGWFSYASIPWFAMCFLTLFMLFVLLLLVSWGLELMTLTFAGVHRLARDPNPPTGDTFPAFVRNPR